MELTDGRGVDLVYEHVGGDRFADGWGHWPATAGW